jgi:8-oxo-dGTP pyrophosphatase MutT (NUDIX family)
MGMKMSDWEIRRAGLIPVYTLGKGTPEQLTMMLFMKPSHPHFGGPDFQIAKGLIDSGETPLEAAIREGQEELGVQEKDYDGEPIRVGIFNKVAVYAVWINDPVAIGKWGWETAEVAWMTHEQFMATGRDIHRPIVDITAQKLGIVK